MIRLFVPHWYEVVQLHPSQPEVRSFKVVGWFVNVCMSVTSAAVISKSACGYASSSSSFIGMPHAVMSPPVYSKKCDPARDVTPCEGQRWLTVDRSQWFESLFVMVSSGSPPAS